jgi:ankyrin repeat protein
LKITKKNETISGNKNIEILLQHAWPLNYALSNGEYEIAKLLIEKGANVNSTQSDGSTPLHLAIYSIKYEIIELLVQKGADLNSKDEYGSTPLDIALQGQIIEENEVVEEKELVELLKIEIYLRTILQKR